MKFLLTTTRELYSDDQMQKWSYLFEFEPVERIGDRGVYTLWRVKDRHIEFNSLDDLIKFIKTVDEEVVISVGLPLENNQRETITIEVYNSYRE